MSGEMKRAVTLYLPMKMDLMLAIQKALIDAYPGLDQRPWGEVVESEEGSMTFLVPERAS